VLVSPDARRGYVDHSIYGFESILKMIRYRYGLAPLTPRDLFANNIAAAFDFESDPRLEVPTLPTPPIMSSACGGTPILDSSGVGVDDGPLLADPVLGPEAQSAGMQALHTSGSLERMGFQYRKATPATLYSHPSSMGLRV
jgi:phospholipase C